MKLIHRAAFHGKMGVVTVATCTTQPIAIPTTLITIVVLFLNKKYVVNDAVTVLIFCSLLREVSEI